MCGNNFRYKSISFYFFVFQFPAILPPRIVELFTFFLKPCTSPFFPSSFEALYSIRFSGGNDLMIRGGGGGGKTAPLLQSSHIPILFFFSFLLLLCGTEFLSQVSGEGGGRWLRRRGEGGGGTTTGACGRKRRRRRRGAKTVPPVRSVGLCGSVALGGGPTTDGRPKDLPAHLLGRGLRRLPRGEKKTGARRTKRQRREEEEEEEEEEEGFGIERGGGGGGGGGTPSTSSFLPCSSWGNGTAGSD